MFNTGTNNPVGVDGVGRYFSSFRLPRSIVYSTDSAPVAGTLLPAAALPDPSVGNRVYVMMAFDVDNGRLWIGDGGTWCDNNTGTGDPANGTNPTNAGYESSITGAAGGEWLPFVGGYNGGSGNDGYNDTFEMNSGSAPYAISSGNADANGYGNFEYAVPSGFYALNTKNLAEFGG